MAVFQPAHEGERNVVVATNVAEASVTIDGIVYVIDCGFVKMRAYNPKSGIESLLVAPISQASALQRTGRAGRTKPGKCYRLYSKEAYSTLQQTSIPEIQRMDLALVILALKTLGIDNVLRFEYLSPPPAESMIRAMELLFSLQALNEYGRLTSPLGQRMAEVPLAPSMARMLVGAQRWGCAEEVLSLAAMCSVQRLWVQAEGDKRMERRKFTVEEGDHLTLLNLYTSFVTNGQKSSKWAHQHLVNFKALSRAVSIRAQLIRYLERFRIPINACKECESERVYSQVYSHGVLSECCADVAGWDLSDGQGGYRVVCPS